jgi:glycosyltransferase involved in cell wall biosynthesis
MNAPKVSIGLPVWNGEKYLRLALDSILQQDYTDFELIISDNASTDRTQEICQEFAAKDKRIRYSRNQTNIGSSGNYNRVFELARGQFFKWASHDDEIHTSLLRRCLESFEHSAPNTVLVFSKAEIIDGSGRALRLSEDTIDQTAHETFTRLASLIFHRHYAHPLWGLIRSEALRRTRLMGGIEADHVLLAELALQGPFVEIPEILYRQRRHAGSAMEVHRSARELLAWHDPSRAKVRFLLPRWIRWDVEYWKGIRFASLSRFDRLLCYAVILGVPLWRWLLKVTGPLRQRLGLRRHTGRLVEEPDTGVRAA